jgi:MFS family permease
MPASTNSKRLNTLNGILNAVSTELVAPFLVIFAVRIGANSFQTALLSSGPAIAGLLVLIPGARWVDRQKHLRRVTAALMTANRFFYLLMVAVPFVLPPWQAGIFVLLVTAMNAPGAVATAAWQSYVAHVFPSETRAEAFAARNRAMNLFGTVTTLTAGALLDLIGATWGYQLMFFGAFVVAIAEIKVFTAIEAPPLRSEASIQPDVPPVVDGVSVPAPAEAAPLLPLRLRLRRQLRELGTNAAFLRYTGASIVFYFAWQTPWTLFSLYQVKELGAGNAVLGLLTLMNTGGNVFGYRFWVRRIERRGNLHVQWQAASALVLVPFTYSLVGFLPRTALFGVDLGLYLIGALNIVIGVSLSGLNLALFNSLLESTPERQKTSYIAYYNTATTLTAVLAPLWGVTAYEVWGYQTAFLICGGQRILGLAALVWLWRRNRVQPRVRSVS